ncbi:hypothetical protein [Legionella waltersii]|uniref:Coiled coil domain-containing protein n=1 Tax=Legionella waltersii TaxID=66969 RepID=A0A0W1A1T1_9GAMM|nr:hypothetical protein [Legionella waltersii]KTD75238.1 coiled coil domain-containing protein [Legionella waltersii]SNV06649.1 coiled coil domain protein [Legionella waltersii]
MSTSKFDAVMNSVKSKAVSAKNSVKETVAKRITDTRWMHFVNEEIEKAAMSQGGKVDPLLRGAQLGISDKTSFDASAFDKVDAVRVGDYSGFNKDTKLPNGVSFVERLKDDKDDNEHKKFVRDKIKQSLAQPPELATVKKNFKGLSEDFKKLLAKVPQTYFAGDLTKFMAQEVTEARQKLVDQQQLELRQLTENFNDDSVNGFKSHFMQATGTDENDYPAAKKRVIDDLKASHTKQLQEFDNSSKESLKNLEQAASNQMLQIGLIRQTMIHNEKQRQNVLNVQQAYHERRKKEDPNYVMDPLRVDLDGSGDEIRLCGITLNDFERLYTNSGKEIIKTKNDETGTATWTISFGLKDRLQFYNNPVHDNLKADLLLMAQAVRSANPDDEITMNLKGFHSDEIAREKARVAYEACILAGYPPEKINIQINGKAIPVMWKKNDKGKDTEDIDDKALFKDHQHEYATLKKQSEEIIKGMGKFKPILVEKGGTTQEEMKQEVKGLRETRKLEEARLQQEAVDEERRVLQNN